MRAAARVLEAAERREAAEGGAASSAKKEKQEEKKKLSPSRRLLLPEPNSRAAERAGAWALAVVDAGLRGPGTASADAWCSRRWPRRCRAASAAPPSTSSG